MGKTQELIEHLTKNEAEPLLAFRVTWGPEAGRVPPDDRASVILDALQQQSTVISAAEIDRDLPIPRDVQFFTGARCDD